MLILFYQNSLQEDEIVSYNVHILEVLNNLFKLGHTIIYANGEYHSFMAPSRSEAVSRPSHTESCWEKVKKFLRSSPFRGEALILYYFIKEIQLFLFALRTVIRSRPDLIYRRHTLFNSEYLLSRIFNIPCVMEVNGIISEESEIRNKGGSFSLWLIKYIETNNFNRADKHIVVTSNYEDLLFSNYHVPMNKIVTIENGANTDLFRPMDILTVKKELHLDNSKSFLCFVGGLAIWHGVKYFISAMPLVLKENPHAMALIVGEGSLVSELENLSKQLGIADKVIFTGRIAYEKVPLYINASEICVIPAFWSGQRKIGLSSLKLCEYLACGKPVIASRFSGFEFVEENDCGFLVNQGSPEELAKAIITLLCDADSKQRMGDNGRKYVLENRSWESVAKKVARVCENIIRERKNNKK
jgi:glycosyltransferase involved in cell wall biosynthesis